jgi:stearoyl-CoA desaturase (delta-9 desaturase)
MIELIYLLVCTHITIVCVTLYLHRGQAHRGIEFHPNVEHFIRFWLWLTTGMITKEWVAIHRKHHQNSDKEGDPHSPHVEGIWTILFSGVYYYIQTSKDRDMVQKYGVGTPDDWIEKNIYSKFPYAGITLLLLINLLCFSWWGIWVWAVQMIWIPFWAAGVINGLGHYYGYRNYDSKDKSTNILPWGIIIGGEELHNNHHGDVGNPKLSRKWLEFDIGWMWLSLLRKLKLAKLRNEGNT